MQIKVRLVLIVCHCHHTIFNTFVKNSKIIENCIVSVEVRFDWARSLSTMAIRKVTKMLVSQCSPRPQLPRYTDLVYTLQSDAIRVPLPPSKYVFEEIYNPTKREVQSFILFPNVSNVQPIIVCRV